MEITQEYVQSVFRYDNNVGELVWAKSGLVAGTLKSAPYRKIRLGAKNYMAHRLIWLYIYGTFPKHHIDHINCNKLDNRLENLREATTAQNRCNCGIRSNNKSGFKGVSQAKGRKTWRAQITIDRQTLDLGTFKTRELASEAYQSAVAEYHGEFARVV